MPSVDRLQQWIKEWAVGVDQEVEVQVLPPHDDPREAGRTIPIRLGRRGYQWTIGFPECMFVGPALSEETCRALSQAVRCLLYMEARGLPR
jgi:hypothetical protein